MYNRHNMMIPPTSSTRRKTFSRRTKSFFRHTYSLLISILGLLILFIFIIKLLADVKNLKSAVALQNQALANMTREQQDYNSLVDSTNLMLLDNMLNIQDQINYNDEIVQKLDEKVSKELNITLHTFNKTVTAVTSSAVTVKEEVKNLTNNVDTYVNNTQDQFDSQNSMMAYQFSGTFTILGSLIAIWHMSMHLRNFSEPIVQRKILAILLMSPIYSITSFLSQVFVSYVDYFAIIKDFYEAYCIYTFLSFLIAVLGRGDRNKVVELLAKHGMFSTHNIYMENYYYYFLIFS